MYVVGASFSLASLHFSSNNVNLSATNVRKKGTCKFALFDAEARWEENAYIIGFLQNFTPGTEMVI